MPPFYKNTTFKGSKRWKSVFNTPRLKTKRNRDFLNIFWLYFTTHELHLQKKSYFFLIHPYKIYHVYTKRNIYYKYALRVPSTKGRQKKKKRTRPNFKDASLETCFMYFSLLKKKNATKSDFGDQTVWGVVMKNFQFLP